MKIKKGSRILFDDVEVAESYTSRVKGLSGRKSIGHDGFLMVFPWEGKHGIWMPMMKFAIDIVYIDSCKRVVDIKKHARPMSLNPMTWKVFRPRKGSKYVLELPSGKSGPLKIGDMLSFDMPKPR